MLEIRRYRPDDREAVFDLHVLALDKVGTYTGPGPWDDDLEDVEGEYLASGGEFLVGIYGSVVDHDPRACETRPPGAHVPKNHRMTASPPFQSHGSL